MLMDFEIRGCTRTCAISGQTLKPGETYFSVLEWRPTGIERSDYSVLSWKGPPESCVGWWRSQLPSRDDAQPKLAPVDVMLNLFESLADHSGEAEFRYLLGLLLLRRRVLRRTGSSSDGEGREVLELDCPRRSAQYELLVAEPEPEMADKLQTKMFNLLYGGDGSGEVLQTSDESKP